MENKTPQPGHAPGDPVADRTTLAANHAASLPAPPDAELLEEAASPSPAAAVKIAAGAVAAVGLTAGAVALLNAHQDAEPPDGELPENSTLYQLPVAREVTDAMSFAEAFGTARADAGPDGLFYWHGEWYSCHTLDEFGDLSPSESYHIQVVEVPREVVEAGPPPLATLTVLPVTPDEELPELVTEAASGDRAPGLSGNGTTPAAATGTASGTSPSPAPSRSGEGDPTAAGSNAPLNAPPDSDYDGVADSQDYFPLDASLS